MPAQAVVQQIKHALDLIKGTNLDDPRLDEVLSLAENLAETMKTFFSALDGSVYSEFRYIAEYISAAREEISSLQPNDLRENRLPGAGVELAAVVDDTENATESIMSEAEAVMELENEDLDGYRDAVNDAMLRIIEACSFQDITGQRVKKVVSTLTHIEERIARFAEVMGVEDANGDKTEKQQWEEENLLNGPAVGGPENSQSAVDDLFDSIDINSDDFFDNLEVDDNDTPAASDESPEANQASNEAPEDGPQDVPEAGPDEQRRAS